MGDYLFARPSLLEGIARNVDLFGVLNQYNYSNTPKEADALALKNDLACLKQDMKIAFTEVVDGDRS